jgi:hypothetical protein
MRRAILSASMLVAAALAVSSVMPAAAQGARREPSTLDSVKTWTNTQWRSAQREWRKDKAKWASCRQQAKQKKLTGRANWSFHYECMSK